MSVKNLNLKRPTKGEVYRWMDGSLGLWTEAHGFAQLKHKLLRERLTEETDPELRSWLKRAAEESAAVAWTTPFPLLVWPELLEEASRTARSRVERQRAIRERTRPHRVLAA